jgi:hypothetical protein|tara:strand:- start:1615 stop:2202 length:588 start_codon:yes stop_codon:yes gene_type:complete
MRDDLFAVPIRKYHIDNNDIFLEETKKAYSKSKFEVPSPFIIGLDQIPPECSQKYGELLEEFMTDLGVYDTHNAVITSFILKVLEQGESVDRMDTLPSHYTLVHYVDCGSEDTSDTFHHPARMMLNAFRPAAVDEWQDAAGLYINKGDVIIHPSFMEHSSPTKKGSGQRITLTLTIVLQQRNEQGRNTDIKEPAA